MTPLIDVMLVLLVIFMITAPLMTSSLKLDLPKTDAAQPSDTPQFISVALDRDGRYFFGDEAVDAAAFAARVAAAAKKQSADRGAAARRQGGALRPRRRADRHRPEGRADADRLRRRTGEVAARIAPARGSSMVGRRRSAERAASAGASRSSSVIGRGSRTGMFEPVRYSSASVSLGGGLRIAAQPAASCGDDEGEAAEMGNHVAEAGSEAKPGL